MTSKTEFYCVKEAVLNQLGVAKLQLIQKKEALNYWSRNLSLF